jgi:hypothetical protein
MGTIPVIERALAAPNGLRHLGFGQMGFSEIEF